MTGESKEIELLTNDSGTLSMPYEWSIGKYGSLFFKYLREKRRFLGIRCPRCGKVMVPPRRICGPCFQDLGEKDIVELSDTGTIMAFSVVNYPFIDPATGLKRPIPYTYGYINIDGSDNIFSHVINGTDETKIKVGMKVRAVFREKMEGNIQDIKYFEIIR
ncbi:MAG: Zn-ribbon domain-containing OB-fold protein [Desulfobacterales bacterium]|nr:Zn-ribbon domain-containing OB-fold protein [Desulfobacterales bacterium]